MPRIIVERLVENAWPRFRAIRLRALAEAPNAFGSTLEREVAFAEADWRRRLGEDCAVVVARRGDADVAVAGGAPFDGRAGLFGVWVAPEARGAGAGRAVCAEVIAWAREAGHAELALDVADRNPAAIALYEGLGFERSGRTGTLPAPRTHVTEHERVLQL